MPTPLKILIFCEEFHQEFLTGPQKRKFQLHQLLAQTHDVSIAVANSSCKEFQDMKILSINDKSFSNNLATFDILIVSPQSFESTPSIDVFNGKIIVDLYIPTVLEHQYTFEKEDQIQTQFFKDQSLYYKAFSCGDLFLCANNSQLHFYQGMMTAMGRLIRNQELICVPFFATEHHKPLYTSDKIKIAWIGGFWNWFQPEPFIEQVSQIIDSIPNIELHFVGIDHPFSKFPLNKEAINKIKYLQSQFSSKLFIHPWMNGQIYQDFLHELQGVVLLSKYKTEEEYSIRTRLFEILEAKVPVILNSNDELAKLIAVNNLGVQVCTNNKISFTKVIQELLTTNTKRNWNEFLLKFDKKDLQKSLLSCIDSLQHHTKSQTNNPYFIQKLKWNYKFLWKLKRAKKLGFIGVLNKLINIK